MSIMSSTAQQEFLDHLVENKVSVAIFLTNGTRLQGYVEDYDQYVLFLSCPTGKQLVYKSVISTVVPARTTRRLYPSY